ncbi:MAG TPA: class I SAM-dependent methyltransferase [Thiohalobacter sp.]|nr:class I SAM-dependent methyltransferase [Thiohalobacter sp.]
MNASKSSKKHKKGRGARTNKPTLASQADRHILYQHSVQDTEFEFEFINATFERLRGRQPHLLREDFCGTAQMCCEWVRRDLHNRAVGVDLDTEVLDWAREHNISQLEPEQRERVQLIEGDVLEVGTAQAPDLIIAMNFSYQGFKTREALRGYFERVREALTDDGVLIMDAFGGYEAFQELEEETEHDDFTYIWDQDFYDPITGAMTCHIHFSFPDGSRMDKAFTYHWRLWTLPELQELLKEAGFRRVTVYWEGTDEETNEGDGNFQPATQGEADPGWIAFLSAEK